MTTIVIAQDPDYVDGRAEAVVQAEFASYANDVHIAASFVARDGTSPTSIEINNTYTDASNRETGYARWSSNVFQVGTEKAGTGSARLMEFQTNGITRQRIDNDFQIRYGNQGGDAPSCFTFALAATTSPGEGRGLTFYGRNIFANSVCFAMASETVLNTSGDNTLFRLNGGYLASSGNCNFSVIDVIPIINQSGSASGAMRGVHVAPTITAASNWRSFDTNVSNGFAYYSSGTAPSKFGGDVTVMGLHFLGVYTVATLPAAASNAGAFAQVTDATSTTNGTTVAGGGSNRVPVFSNGTNWIVK